MSSQPTTTTDLEKQIEAIGFRRTLESIDSLPDTKAPLKYLLKAAVIGESAAIQPLYTGISECPDSKISSLVQKPNVLLRAMLNISIELENIAVVKQLLAILPPPEPDLRTFINEYKPGTTPGPKATPQMWLLMLNHGRFDADQYSSALDWPLYSTILSNGPHCSEVTSLMLDYGVKPDMGHLTNAMKRSNIEVLRLLLKYYPETELKKCRLLHDTIAWGKIEIVRWLLDVAKMDVNLFPSEGPRVQHEEMNPGGKAEPNGTPLHEAVVHNQVGIVSLLLKRGARKDIKNDIGQTAYEVAKEKHHWFIMAYLFIQL